jgi:Family of unknown function (DUF6152)
MTPRLLLQRLGISAAAMSAFAAAPAFAHHSFSAYDMSKTQTVSGSIKEFRWGAPHSSMVLLFLDKNGKQQAMSVVTGSPLALSRQGFTPRDFHAGDKVVLTYHPNASGAMGGAMATLTLPNGRTYRDGEAAAGGKPGAPPPPPGPPGK